MYIGTYIMYLLAKYYMEIKLVNYLYAIYDMKSFNCNFGCYVGRYSKYIPLFYESK